MNPNTLFSNIYLRLLKESLNQNIDGYGANTVINPFEIRTVVYDVPSVEDIILSQGPINHKFSYRELANMFLPYIISYTSIKKAGDPCWGAYQINEIAGPGKLAYAMAYATSPSGRLISDRKLMTNKAINAWKNMASKPETEKQPQRKRFPLDNKEHPQTPAVEDDCEFREEDFLNYAYESQDWEKPLYDRLKAEHGDFITRLQKGEVNIALVQGSLNIAGDFFFVKNYNTQS